MLVFIDESGDAGFKIEKGSSPVFIVALIIFDDELVAEEVALNIKKLRRELNKSDGFEFKFNKMTKDLRLKFIKTIKNSHFRVRAIVFRKELLYSLNLRKDTKTFYSYAVKTVLKHHNESIKNAKIRLDGLGERAFRKSLHVYLRKELNNSERQVLKDFQFVDSKKNVLIQLADIVAGSIKRSYDHDKSDKEVYRKELGERLEDVWDFK